MTKVIAVFRAGTGLGASLARRFGTEGYRVAPVVGGFIARSTGYPAVAGPDARDGDLTLPDGSTFPVVDPDNLAEQLYPPASPPSLVLIGSGDSCSVDGVCSQPRRQP